MQRSLLRKAQYLHKQADLLNLILSGGAEGEEIRGEKGAEEPLLPVVVREIIS